MKSFKYINCGCRSGVAVFPVSGCLEVIKEGDTNGFVLVEASEWSEGFCEFVKEANELGFDLYRSFPHKNANQVMIGVKSSIKVLGVNDLPNVAPQHFTGRGVGVNSVSSGEVVKPNYLHVTLETDEGPLDLIGARIPSYTQFKNGNMPTAKCYNAALCSFRMLLEALDNDLLNERAVLLVDSNSALHYGDFYGPYDPDCYKGKAQKNYNLQIFRDELFSHSLILKEGLNDCSWFHGIHLDHALFKGIDVERARVSFHSKECFDHSWIEVELP